MHIHTHKNKYVHKCKRINAVYATCHNPSADLKTMIIEYKHNTGKQSTTGT